MLFIKLTQINIMKFTNLVVVGNIGFLPNLKRKKKSVGIIYRTTCLE